MGIPFGFRTFQGRWAAVVDAKAEPLLAHQAPVAGVGDAPRPAGVNFIDLPPLAHARIADHLAIDDAMALATTCKSMLAIVSRPHLLAKQVDALESAPAPAAHRQLQTSAAMSTTECCVIASNVCIGALLGATGVLGCLAAVVAMLLCSGTNDDGQNLKWADLWLPLTVVSAITIPPFATAAGFLCGLCRWPYASTTPGSQHGAVVTAAMFAGARQRGLQSLSLLMVDQHSAGLSLIQRNAHQQRVRDYLVAMQQTTQAAALQHAVARRHFAAAQTAFDVGPLPRPLQAYFSQTQLESAAIEAMRAGHMHLGRLFVRAAVGTQAGCHADGSLGRALAQELVRRVERGEVQAVVAMWQAPFCCKPTAAGVNLVDQAVGVDIDVAPTSLRCLGDTTLQRALCAAHRGQVPKSLTWLEAAQGAVTGRQWQAGANGVLCVFAQTRQTDAALACFAMGARLPAGPAGVTARAQLHRQMVAARAARQRQQASELSEILIDQG